MTPKPSEAELSQLQRLTTIEHPRLGDTRAAFDALPGLLARIRRLETVAHDVSVTMGRANGNLTARAEAAEKRVAELEAERAADDVALSEAWREVGRLEAQLATLRATPAAAVREALASLLRLLRDDADHACPEVLEAIAKAETALAGAEAGERKLPERRNCAHGRWDCNLCDWAVGYPREGIDGDPKEAP